MTIRILAFLGALALTAAPVLAADSIDAIIANPASFDGKHVAVTGTVDNVKMKTSRRGNDYTTFDLCQTQCVHVYAHGHANVTKGATVSVTGDFVASRTIGTFTVTNQITADDDTGIATPAPAASSRPR